jgi:hypothetical protein
LSKEEDKIAALEAKLRNKTEVLAEVVEELCAPKKTWGELSGRWVAHDTRDNVIDFIKRLSAPHRDQLAVPGGLDGTLPLQVLPMERSLRQSQRTQRSRST